MSSSYQKLRASAEALAAELEQLLTAPGVRLPKQVRDSAESTLRAQREFLDRPAHRPLQGRDALDDQIAELQAAGKSLGEIAAAVGLTVPGVRYRLNRPKRKTRP